MSYEQVMEVTAPLIAGAEGAAALAARMRLDALGEAGDPEVRAALDQVVSALADPSISWTWTRHSDSRSSGR